MERVGKELCWSIALISEHLTIRLGKESDQEYLVNWLLQPGVLEGFPLADLREVEDAARIWLSYSKQGAVLTALWDGVPCGIANLYLSPYKKLAHQCLFAIIVDEKYRGKGVGRKLLEALIKLAKEQFHLELLHLEVYAGNPAIHLYEKLGFEEYGVHKRFLKSVDGRYLDKILMQKKL
jgi:RimJ/RimL family protein N-acetyltransferase